MTPQEAREAAAVMLAFADGKKIECKLKHQSDQWSILNRPVWNWESAEYRVSPETWTGKIWVRPDGRSFAPDDQTDAQMMEADGWKLITAKEVGDE